MINENWDKINGDVAFYEEEHKYINIKNPNIKYISVTTLISEFYEPFDSYFMSRYKALQEVTNDSEAFRELKEKYKMTKRKLWKDEFLEMLDVDPEEHQEIVDRLLGEWKQKNEEACTIGTAIHLERENEFYDDNINVNDLVKRYVGVTGDFNCVKHDFDLARVNSVMPEYLVYYSCPEDILHIAGQVDLIIKEGKRIKIVDFKTNEKGIETKAFFSRTEGFKKMYYPLNHMHDTTMNHYNLQLSIYGFLLKKIDPELIIDELKVIHIDRSGKETEYVLPYLEEEVKRMLSHKKTLLKDEAFKQTMKRI